MLLDEIVSVSRDSAKGASIEPAHNRSSIDSHVCIYFANGRNENVQRTFGGRAEQTI